PVSSPIRIATAAPARKPTTTRIVLIPRSSASVPLTNSSQSATATAVGGGKSSSLTRPEVEANCHANKKNGIEAQSATLSIHFTAGAFMSTLVSGDDNQ